MQRTCETCKYGKRFDELTKEERRAYRMHTGDFYGRETDKLLCVIFPPYYRVVEKDHACPEWEAKD